MISNEGRRSRQLLTFGQDHAAKNKELEQDQFILLQLSLLLETVEALLHHS
ncbi:hypothetical protein SAZ10_08815 [Mesorhizobium sp. BAC0120]|uniref:hypothetical protein n=1 Tax=Mesorhizobium sp. BAC0120 TaxID=3090670 RepID=UPI00298C2FA7|nr:hypothetical protein [Mesorhizobium sp. BAC0120]MDW6021861.1 hypothetical protein [Mesorhizobium sp. BAC0120]